MFEGDELGFYDEILFLNSLIYSTNEYPMLTILPLILFVTYTLDSQSDEYQLFTEQSSTEANNLLSYYNLNKTWLHWRRIEFLFNLWNRTGPSIEYVVVKCMFVVKIPTYLIFIWRFSYSLWTFHITFVTFSLHAEKAWWQNISLLPSPSNHTDRIARLQVFKNDPASGLLLMKWKRFTFC